MDTKTVLIGLVVGLLVGAGLGYGMMSPQVSTLQGKVSTLQSQADLVPNLQQQLSILTSDKTSLQGQVTVLQGQVNSVNSQIAILQSQALTKDTEINDLKAQVNTLKSMLPPLPPSNGEPGSSRFFPASIGTSITTNYVRGSSTTYTAIITVLQVVRGADAWATIYAANPYNSPAPVGTEYILAKVRYNYLSGPAMESLSDWTFQFFSGSGVKYDQVSVVGLAYEFSYTLYPGNMVEGWVAIRVSTTDLTPLLSFAVASDGSGGTWYKIY